MPILIIIQYGHLNSINYLFFIFDTLFSVPLIKRLILGRCLSIIIISKIIKAIEVSIGITGELNIWIYNKLVITAMVTKIDEPRIEPSET